MAHTFGAQLRIPETALSTSTATSISGTFTCITGTTVLCVMLAYAGITDRTGGAPTYNGVALTQAGSRQGVTEASVESWFLIDPPTNQPLMVGVPNANGRTILAVVGSGKAQSGYTSALDNFGSNATTAANPTVSVTGTVAGDIIFAVVATGDNAFAPTARTGTSMFEEDIAGWGFGAQYYIKTGTGAQVLSWIDATSDDYGAIAAAFREALISGTVYNDIFSVSRLGNINTSILSTINASISLPKSNTFPIGSDLFLSENVVLGKQLSFPEVVITLYSITGGYAFGEQNPTQGETAVSWQTWSNGVSGTPTISGDPAWGKLILDESGEEGRSAVYDLGSTGTRTFTLFENRYGTGSTEPVLSIRGDSIVFLQDDELPAWEVYSSPVSRSWRYVQVRESTIV